MIFKPSAQTPHKILNENLRKHLHRFSVYDENRCGDPVSADYVGSIGNLIDTVYMDYVRWDDPPAVITGELTGAADTLILGNCSADFLTGTIGGWDVTEIPLLSGSRTRITTNPAEDFLIAGHANAEGTDDLEIAADLAPGETEPSLFDQRIWLFKFPEVSGGEYSLTLKGAAPVTLHKLFIGKAEELIPCSSFKWNTVMQGAGAWTDLGVVYGHKRDGRREAEFSWTLHDDGERRRIERYIERVQNVQPHFVDAHSDHEYIGIMFAALDTEGFDGQVKDASRWFWDGQTLKYREAK